MAAKEKISTVELLIPMALMASTLVLLFGFQISQIMTDRDSLNQALGRLETPFVQSQNLNKQFGGLVAGSKKLADQGNKSAKKIVGQLKKLGIIVEPPKEQGNEPVTGANKLPPKGPKKP